MNKRISIALRLEIWFFFHPLAFILHPFSHAH